MMDSRDADLVIAMVRFSKRELEELTELLLKPGGILMTIHLKNLVAIAYDQRPLTH